MSGTDRDSYFSQKQIDTLLRPIKGERVLNLRGMAYVGAHDIKAHLSRIFGFGRWWVEIRNQELVLEEPAKIGGKDGQPAKDGWHVCYRTSLRLTIFSPDGDIVCSYDDAHVGESTVPSRGEAHGNALTSSVSYALKRCAANLGDQFGLSLYDKGSRAAIVKGTLVHARGIDTDADVSENVAPVTSLGNDERDETVGAEEVRNRQAPADPTVEAKRKVWVLAKQLGMDVPELAADFARCNGGEVLDSAGAATLMSYWGDLSSRLRHAQQEAQVQAADRVRAAEHPVAS